MWARDHPDHIFIDSILQKSSPRLDQDVAVTAPRQTGLLGHMSADPATVAGETFAKLWGTGRIVDRENWRGFS